MSQALLETLDVAKRAKATNAQQLLLYHYDRVGTLLGHKPPPARLTAWSQGFADKILGCVQGDEPTRKNRAKKLHAACATDKYAYVYETSTDLAKSAGWMEFVGCWLQAILACAMHQRSYRTAPGTAPQPPGARVAANADPLIRIAGSHARNYRGTTSWGGHFGTHAFNERGPTPERGDANVTNPDYRGGAAQGGATRGGRARGGAAAGGATRGQGRGRGSGRGAGAAGQGGGGRAGAGRGHSRSR